MESIREQYKGYIISYQKVPLLGGTFQVSVASNDENLMAKIGLGSKVISGRDMEDAKSNARRFVDVILGQ